MTDSSFASPAPPPDRPVPGPSTRGRTGVIGRFQTIPGLTILIAVALLASFALQWPTHRVADWQQFSFYDPGTILKGDLLLEKGYIPTVDFGYTHGLISLLYGRVGFSFFGRTPWTFLALTCLAEIGMAWGLARILVATGLAKQLQSLAFVLVALPMAIMPAYLTLTHPLEAMLILLALAAQAEGAKAKALGILTVCLFVKPSMAYVYGFLLVLLIAWENRKSVAQLIQQLIPAAITFIVLALALALRFGWLPVFRTLLPLTGAKTYATTGFGFFNESGREFWLPQKPLDFVIAPPGIFLIAAAACAVAAALGPFHVLNRGDASAETRRPWELAGTVGLLHTAFLLGFYGWTGSWTYYSYLPILGVALLLLCVLQNPVQQRRAFVALAVFMLVSHTQLFGVVFGAWFGKTPHSAPIPAAAPGLWRYADKYADWDQIVHALADQPTLVMTNGYLSPLPSTIEMPDAWFPEPGIPTASEVARVKAQAARVRYVVLFWEYRKFDLWNSPDFDKVREQFSPVLTTAHENFTLLERVAPPATAAP